MGGSLKKARETGALPRLSRTAECQEGGRTEPSPSCLWHDTSPEGGGETWLSLRGRYVPVGRCPAADRGGSRDAGAVRRLRGRGATVREKRFAVSLAFPPALRAAKVKVVGRCPTPGKLFEKSLSKNITLASLGHPYRPQWMSYTLRRRRFSVEPESTFTRVSPAFMSK